MIKLRPFEILSYKDIREKYLEKLVESHAVAFDEADILDNGESEGNGSSANSFVLLNDFPALRNYLYDENKQIKRHNLRQILIGPDEAPRSLDGRGEFASMRNVFDKIIFDIDGNNSNISIEAVDACKKIFKYNKLNIIQKGLSEKPAFWLQEQLGVRVCPYCNRIYTTILSGKKGIRPNFDHFYPMSRYPYLAVSLFNLIPSCDICNGAKSANAEIKNDFKKTNKNGKSTYTQKKSIIYPYDESYDELKLKISFRIIPDEKPNEVIMGQSDKFTVELRPTEHSKWLEFSDSALTRMKLDERFKYEINTELTEDEEAVVNDERLFWDRAKQTIDLLRLEGFYNEHKSEIMKMLRFHYEYNQVCRQFIMHPLSKFFAATVHTFLFSGDRDLLYLASLQPEEWGNEPLNKLKSDILHQLEEMENAE